MEVCRHSALFAETFNKEVSNVLCGKPIILVELLFELRIVVIEAQADHSMCSWFNIENV